MGERLFFGLCSKVLSIVRSLDSIPEEFEHLEAMLSDIYYCNYSIFQSMPDTRDHRHAGNTWLLIVHPSSLLFDVASSNPPDRGFSAGDHRRGRRPFDLDRSTSGPILAGARGARD